ncbi:MAG TPA: nitrilase-related carbon-nitrogen hydrolase [Dehalococcoidia bacterium]|nr:nitrilase-related carbon-nitrogen hydrolase [Dehalococcoidia bacterium]
MTEHLAAAAQLGPASPSRAATVARIVSLITAAAGAGAELVVFPELALTPYFPAAIHDDVSRWFEQELPSPETWAIFEAAAQRRIAVMLPFAEQDGDARFMSAVLIDAHGKGAGRYRKNHIPGRVDPAPDGRDACYEKRYFAPGDLGYPLYDSPVGKLGMLICYDLRFPESYRCCGLAGAELIGIGYNTDLGSEFTGDRALELGQERHELPMRAGAAANGVYVIAAGKGGEEAGIRYLGGSCIIAPNGEIIARARGDGDELVMAKIDRERGRAIRERLNLAQNRRPEQYGILTRVRAAV